MHKLLPLLTLIVAAAISIGRPVAAEWRFAGPLSSPFATDAAGSDAPVVLVAGKGGGTGGGGTTGGGMGAGPTGGGMGGPATGGGMGGGTTGGGMGGGTTGGGMGSGTTGGGMGSGMTGGGMFSPAPSFGTSGNGEWPGNSAQPSYYTYQCATSAGGCSFVAPASLRSSSLRVGARCSCSDGLSQGQIK